MATNIVVQCVATLRVRPDPHNRNGIRYERNRMFLKYSPDRLICMQAPVTGKVQFKSSAAAAASSSSKSTKGSDGAEPVKKKRKKGGAATAAAGQDVDAETAKFMIDEPLDLKISGADGLQLTPAAFT